MDDKKEQESQEVESQGYIPRPEWQIWAARIGLVVFVLIVIYQILSIATGGL